MLIYLGLAKAKQKQSKSKAKAKAKQKQKQSSRHIRLHTSVITTRPGRKCEFPVQQVVNVPNAPKTKKKCTIGNRDAAAERNETQRDGGGHATPARGGAPG